MSAGAWLSGSALAVALTFAAAGALAAPAATGHASKATYEDAYRHAKTLAQQALRDDAAWTVTAPTLKQAEKAAAEGDYDHAEALADRAAALAELSMQQAKEQETAWKAAVLR